MAVSLDLSSWLKFSFHPSRSLSNSPEESDFILLFLRFDWAWSRSDFVSIVFTFCFRRKLLLFSSWALCWGSFEDRTRSWCLVMVPNIVSRAFSCYIPGTVDTLPDERALTCCDGWSFGYSSCIILYLSLFMSWTLGSNGPCCSCFGLGCSNELFLDILKFLS